MMVVDCPDWHEEKSDKLFDGEISNIVKRAMKESNVSPNDGYYTTLVKARKNSTQLTNEQINGCKKFIESEIKTVKPSIIIALGSTTIRHFLPSHKGSISDVIGKSFYDSNLDATIVCGINPAQCAFDSSKFDELVQTFQKVEEILS